MNGNNGLEALAALCGGQAAAVNRSSENQNHSNSSSNNDNNHEANGNYSASSSSSTANGNINIQQSNSGRVPEGFTSQQWQQTVAAAVSSLGGNNSTNNGGLTAQNLALLQAAGLTSHVSAPVANLDSNSLMQQLSYYRYMQDLAKLRDTAGQNSSSATTTTTTNGLNHLLQQNPQALQALFGQQQFQQLQQHLGGTSTTDGQNSNNQSQVLPPAAAPTPSTNTKTSTDSASSMPPPASSSSLPSTLSTAGISHANSSPRHTAIAPLPTGVSDMTSTMHEADMMNVNQGDKKLQKRAANRRSAQLSRKRKKQYIEELKDENDELRRKEQILRSIPDLIVVFDSAGKLCFVSQSVSRFLEMTSKELEGTSFWDRLCEDSVRLLKAAFMDSLAVRTDDSDTAPLGSGIWELRLRDKDGSHKIVALNGVVHFSGDRPECVCSIRPRDELATLQPPEKRQKSAEEARSSDAAAVSVSTGNGSMETAKTSTESFLNVGFQPLIRAKPQQSVISNGNSSSASGSSNGLAHMKIKADGNGKRREAARISDGDSGSADSGSSDELGE